MPEMRQVVAWQRPLQMATALVLWMSFSVAMLVPSLALPIREMAPLGFACATLRTWALWRRSQASILASIAGDAILLTGLLDITGGLFNPFLVVYGVDVWLATAMGGAIGGVLVVTAAGGGLAWLVVDHLQAGLLEHHRFNDFPTHLLVMAFAGASVADLVAVYVVRARDAMAHRQRELDDARERAARSEHLASLTTLAAGAAHELSTPLSTIAVAVKELDRAIRQGGERAMHAAQEDVRLIDASVSRCRAILDGMSGRATGDVAQGAPLTPASIVAEAAGSLPDGRRSRIRTDVDDTTATLSFGVELARALGSLLKNACEASEGDVMVRGRVEAGRLRFEVADAGPGMPDEVHRRAGEPFFTTKPAGEGLGLGLFLVRTIAEQHGGSLRFERTGGTVAILEVPMEATRG